MTRNFLFGTCSGGLAGILLAVTLGATSAPAQEADTTALVSTEGIMIEGKSVYRYRCAECHGRNGEGQRGTHHAAPGLSGYSARMSVRKIAIQVIRGGAYMPPFASLTDQEIAAVITYVRNSFGNDYGLATAEEVAEIR